MVVNVTTEKCLISGKRLPRNQIDRKGGRYISVIYYRSGLRNIETGGILLVGKMEQSYGEEPGEM